MDLDGNLIDKWDQWDLFPDENGVPRHRVLDIEDVGEFLFDTVTRFRRVGSPYSLDCRPDKGSFILADFEIGRVYWALNHCKTISSRKFWPGTQKMFFLPQTVNDVQLSGDGVNAFVSTNGFGKQFTLFKITSATNSIIPKIRSGRPFQSPFYEGPEVNRIAELMEIGGRH